MAEPARQRPTRAAMGAKPSPPIYLREWERGNRRYAFLHSRNVVFKSRLFFRHVPGAPTVEM
ncbi:hypothetical protein AMB3_0720 [plant metagenome]